jgi:hypothetical protein
LEKSEILDRAKLEIQKLVESTERQWWKYEYTLGLKSALTIIECLEIHPEFYGLS